MLKSKQELKISNLFLQGSVGLEGKMNDERMISQTPMVHKLDVLSSWCLGDCSKYVRESQWRRENELSHVDWSFLLLGSKERERECALSHWLVCLAARKQREEYMHCHVGWLVLLLASRETRRDREMVCTAFYVALGRWPGQNGISHSHWAKYINSNSNGQSNSHTK